MAGVGDRWVGGVAGGTLSKGRAWLALLTHNRIPPLLSHQALWLCGPAGPAPIVPLSGACDPPPLTEGPQVTVLSFELIQVATVTNARTGSRLTEPPSTQPCLPAAWQRE